MRISKIDANKIFYYFKNSFCALWSVVIDCKGHGNQGSPCQFSGFTNEMLHWQPLRGEERGEVFHSKAHKEPIN
jgi:hypothetical protein